MKLNKIPTVREYNHITNSFFVSGYGWRMDEAPHSKYGSIYLDSGVQGNPDVREAISRELGVEVALVKDVAHMLSTPDGTVCKPNWFDENFVVLMDKDHHTAVALTPTVERYRQDYSRWQTAKMTCLYPSPDARPHSLFPIEVNMPDIKAGNAAWKRMEVLVGEARLRAGILNIPQRANSYWSRPIRQVCDDFAKGIEPDLTKPETVGCLINPVLKQELRLAFRKTLVLQELVYGL